MRPNAALLIVLMLVLLAACTPFHGVTPTAVVKIPIWQPTNTALLPATPTPTELDTATPAGTFTPSPLPTEAVVKTCFEDYQIGFVRPPFFSKVVANTMTATGQFLIVPMELDNLSINKQNFDRTQFVV